MYLSSETCASSLFIFLRNAHKDFHKLLMCNLDGYKIEKMSLWTDFRDIEVTRVALHIGWDHNTGSWWANQSHRPNFIGLRLKYQKVFSNMGRLLVLDCVAPDYEMIYVCDWTFMGFGQYWWGSKCAQDMESYIRYWRFLGALHLFSNSEDSIIAAKSMDQV